MNRIRGKAAVITGAALGIGRACALRLADEGAAVEVTDVDVSKGSAVVEEIRNEGKSRRLDSKSVLDRRPDR